MLENYKIADLMVEMDCKYDRISRQAKQYKHYGQEQIQDCIHIEIPREKIQFYGDQHPEYTYGDWEYMFTGNEFYLKLLDYNGMLLHSSAVVLDGKAYLFSAASGTGKSTHTKLWLKHFGLERTFILNDDKPAIRIKEREVLAYGTPWSGKYDISKNAKVPLQGIVFLERSEDNWIKRIGAREAVCLFMGQTIRPKEMENMDKLLSFLDKLLPRVSIYKMGCNISEEAVEVAYKGMNEL